ncbi:hypothetical protein [Crocosphaera chwakensis]|uniref:Uncharacterized protein n=1 Tax=Crocosphaera chwakensis CCY0110 TaxID=391612 RepID=A3IP10_9CHRO|nr:hypothetical protein [Crocosphaera chwakensis]EAZ91812.1 hypothetical protein CY0110_07624 [Crocosphaera chwakensis CCY0110]
MITNLLESKESSLVQVKRIGYKNYQNLVFQINKIANCLETIIQNLTLGKSCYSDCSILEEYCQELLKDIDEKMIGDSVFDYHKILSLVFGIKVTLSEIHFADSAKTQSKLGINKSEELEANILTLKNNVQKIRTFSELLAVS